MKKLKNLTAADDFFLLFLYRKSKSIDSVINTDV